MQFNYIFYEKDETSESTKPIYGLIGCSQLFDF